MKSLRHPNIVKLVGVCWDTTLFACCLEFVANGSLEDWLRRTAGGKSYDPSKQKKKKKKKKEKERDAHQVRCELIFKGFDDDGEYDESKHTDEDKRQIERILKTLKALGEECRSSEEQLPTPRHSFILPMSESVPSQVSAGVGGDDAPDPSAGLWTPLTDEGGGAFRHGLKGWSRYNTAIKWGESLAIMPQVDATPAQVFAKYTEKSERSSADTAKIEVVAHDGTTRLEFVKSPTPPGMSDREVLIRGVYKKLDDGSFIDVTYSVEDDRKPKAKGVKRIDINYAMWARPKEGSDGKVCEVWRCLRVDPRFRGMIGMIANKWGAKSAGSNTAAPLVKLKEDTERLAAEYEPVLDEGPGGVVGLSWKGQLLNIATQCALGVQYLHHEQYWADEEKNEDDQIILAGYRECIIHR